MHFLAAGWNEVTAGLSKKSMWQQRLDQNAAVRVLGKTQTQSVTTRCNKGCLYILHTQNKWLKHIYPNKSPRLFKLSYLLSRVLEWLVFY